MRAAWLRVGDDGEGGLTAEWRSAEADFGAGVLAEAKGEPRAPYLVPGLVDIHCHGAFGMDVMEGRAGEVADRLRQLGVEWVCATTVTSPWDAVRRALRAAARARVAGVHLEGPFINPARAGAQPREHARPPSREELLGELGPDLGAVRVVTLAPELDGARDVGEELRARGILVSAGHTDARYEELLAGPALNHMTHFFNAMRPMHHREPGAVGFGLLSDVACELVYDRRHVSREAAELLYRCKGPWKVIGVSDGTKLSGAPEGTETHMWGRRVRKEDGAAVLGDGTLAGSAATLPEVFRNIWRDMPDGRTAAVLACSANPRRALGLPPPGLWLVVDEEGSVLGVREGNLTPLEPDPPGACRS